MAIERQRLYTLVRDPITEVKPGRGGTDDQLQGGTRPFIAWMETVNEALLDLLFETVLLVDDAFLTEFGTLNPDGSYTINDLLIEGSDIIRFNNSVDVYLTGMIASRPSQQTMIVSVGLGNVFLMHLDSRSVPADTDLGLGNQIKNTVDGTAPLASGVGYARFYYDGTDFFWRTITHEQGAPLTPTPEFLLTAFQGIGGTWTVDPGSVKTYAYYLKGAMLHVSLRLLGTSSDAPMDRIAILLPNEYTGKKHIVSLAFLRNTTTDPLTGKAALLQIEASSAAILVEHMNGEAIEGTGTIDLLGQFWMEIGSGGGEFGELPSAGGGVGIPPSAAEVPAPSSASIIATINGAISGNMIAESCQSQGGNWNYMNAAVEALRAGDTRWGFNGKRGNIDDVSEDALAYYYGPLPPWVGSTSVYVFDILTGHCPGPGDPLPTVSAQDVTDYSGTVKGAWVYPRGAVMGTPPSGPVPPIGGGTTTPPGSDAISIGSITFHAARNPSGWAKTSNISSVAISGSQTCVTHSMKDSWAGKALNNGVVVNANGWVGIQIGGNWHMSTWEYFRPGQTCKGLTLGNRAVWDDHVWSPLIGNPPVNGQQVLFMMSTIARNGGDPSNGQERSQIVSVTWPY